MISVVLSASSASSGSAAPPGTATAFAERRVGTVRKEWPHAGLKLDMHDALGTLRGYARRSNRRLSDVARDVMGFGGRMRESYG
jgi:hypothetical protein